jgi:hypothetical protein
MDIEFVDCLDGRKKYCQLKSGPDALNVGDIDTVKTKFQSLRNLARTNYMDVRLGDLVVGVLYGEEKELNSRFLTLQESYNVYIGNDFWTRLTGDDTFYFKLIKIFSKVAQEAKGASILENVVIELAKDIELHKNQKVK